MCNKLYAHCAVIHFGLNRAEACHSVSEDGGFSAGAPCAPGSAAASGHGLAGTAS